MLHKVGSVGEFTDLKPLVVKVGSSTVGVVRYKGKYHAYLNRCPHEGGPACEGAVVPDVQAEVYDRGKVRVSESTESFTIVCPWHGMEFDLETGLSRPDGGDKLKSYEVVVKDDEVFIVR